MRAMRKGWVGNARRGGSCAVAAGKGKYLGGGIRKW